MTEAIQAQSEPICVKQTRKRVQITTTISIDDKKILAECGVKIADALRLGVFSLRKNAGMYAATVKNAQNSHTSLA